MAIRIEENAYKTTDTALAAYLYSEGFELLEVDGSNFPSVFYFENSNPKLSEYIRNFQIGKAEGNIAIFFKSYKTMLARIKDSKYA